MDDIVPLCVEDRNLYMFVASILDRSDSFDSSEHCIYRAPENVRILNEAAYTPHVISIGPYYHGSDRLQSMKGFKKSYCNKLIGKSNKTLENYIDHLKDYEERVHQCYEEDLIFMSRDQFKVMMLVDGLFVIEFLLRSHYTELREPGDDMPSMQLMQIHIKHDLVLFENQLPYFFLESLFNLVDPSSFSPWEESSSSFHDIVMNFFETHNKRKVIPDFTSVKHFTDLVRTLYAPMRQNWDPKDTDTIFTASVTQLHEAGVKFKTVSGKCLLDIEFDNGCLKLPLFELDDDKESLFRNLMAWELRQYPNDTFITDYFVFMDTLINTSNDIDLLVQNGVLLHRLGDSRNAANCFNNFCGRITHSSATSYLIPIHGKLNAYYKQPRHTWMTTFKRDYLSTPWKIASVITAVALVLLTLISTVCSVISIL